MEIVKITCAPRRAQAKVDGVLCDVEIPAVEAEARVLGPSSAEHQPEPWGWTVLMLLLAGAAFGALLCLVVSW